MRWRHFTVIKFLNMHVFTSTMVGESLVVDVFQFEAIVFIKVFNLFTPIGADLNQCFLEPSVFVWFIPK